MALKDVKSKIDKLEDILNPSVDVPAQWALDYVKTLGGIGMKMLDEDGREMNPKTEEESYQDALTLTRNFGTKEKMIEAQLEFFKNCPMNLEGCK